MYYLVILCGSTQTCQLTLCCRFLINVACNIRTYSVGVCLLVAVAASGRRRGRRRKEKRASNWFTSLQLLTVSFASFVFFDTHTHTPTLSQQSIHVVWKLNFITSGQIRSNRLYKYFKWFWWLFQDKKNGNLFAKWNGCYFWLFYTITFSLSVSR